MAQIFPLHSNKTYFGVDWGHHYVKVVGLQKKGRTLALTHCQLFIVPEGGVTQDFKNRVFSGIQKGGQKGQIFWAGIDGAEINARYVKLPEMPKSEFQKAAVWEVKDQLYFPLEEAFLQVIPFGILENDAIKRRHGMVFSFHRPFVHQKLGLFEEFPLKLKGIVLNPQAARLSISEKQAQKENVLVLLVGSKRTHIAIFQGQTIYFMRELDVGGQTITDEIVSYENVTRKKAELLKKRLILEPDGLDIRYAREIQDPDFLYQTIRMPLEKMVDEIRLSLQFYASQVHASVDAIYLAGGGSLLRGLDKYIQAKLGLPVSKIDPFADVNIDPALFEENKIRPLGPIFASAVGLARAAAGAAGDVAPNVLSVVKAEEQSRQKQGVLMRVSSLSALMIVLLAALFFSFKTNQIRAQKIVVDKRLENVRYRLSFIKDLEKKTGKMSARFRDLLAEKGQQPRWSLIFQVLSENIPEQAWVTKLEIRPVKRSRRSKRAGNGGTAWQMVLFGRAYSGSAIREFYNRLQQQIVFNQVSLNSIVLDEKAEGNQQLRFQMTCGIKPDFAQLTEGD